MTEHNSAVKKYAFFDEFPEGVQVISPTYEYLYVNEAVAVQGKSTRDELLGHTMMEKYPGIEETEMFMQITRCVEKKQPLIMLNEFQFADGSMGKFELRLRPVEEGVMIISEDVTAREKTVEENEKLMKFMVDRENRIAELKAEIEELRQQQS